MTPWQLSRWRTRGIDCAGPSATEILLLILDGTTTINALSEAIGLSASATTAHVRRLRGLGLITWTVKRGDPIMPNCVRVYDHSDGYRPA